MHGVTTKIFTDFKNLYLPPYNAKVGFIVLACDQRIPGTTQ